MPHISEVKLDNGVIISHVEGNNYSIKSPKGLLSINSQNIRYKNGSFFYYKNDYISRVEDETILRCLRFIYSDLVTKK